MEMLNSFLAQLDCQQLVLASGVKHEPHGVDGSTFIDCPLCKSEKRRGVMCIRVTKHGFYCFESNKRGGFRDLAMLLASSEGVNQVPAHIVCAIIDAEQYTCTEADAIVEISKLLSNRA